MSRPVSLRPARVRRVPAIGGRRGVAFIVVLWLLALLAVLLGGFALLARGESLQARFLYDGTQARYAAEAGVNRALFALSLPDPQQRWVPDGRPYAFAYADAQIEVRITDESGKLDLNGADPATLAAFFRANGLEDFEAEELAAAIVDWRDPDDLLTPNGAEDAEYAAAGLPYGPRNAPFDVLSELQQVLGMNHDRYREWAPSLTLFSGMSQPNPIFAPEPVLRALPGLDPELARQLIEQRHAFDPHGEGIPPQLPDGSPLVAQAGSGTYTVNSRATLANGAWTQLEITARLGGAPFSGLAYTVLRWQEGEPL